ncbi:Aldo/keto reductase family protein [Sphingopyxis flava]|uniref:Aldo/keto reductase family protein n=1 Tax=Sphingopyxis flava TaxID=1507287 RepID=A0A1T5DFF2_9SPHN|nr:Aldo/keto reductase family protein [Sphingopyxis flava]
MRAAVQGSLDRLGVDAIDLYFAHKDDPDVPLDEVLGAFSELIDTGTVGAIGASNYSAARLAEALELSDKTGLPRFTVVQPELNLLDRAQYEGPLQALCTAEGLGVITYFSLASGYLSGKYRDAADLSKSPRGARVQPYMTGRGPDVLAAMERIAEETGATLPQIALAWVAAQPGVTAPIASATSVAQLDEIMASEAVTLTPEQIAALTEAGRA